MTTNANKKANKNKALVSLCASGIFSVGSFTALNRSINSNVNADALFSGLAEHAQSVGSDS